MPKDCLDKFQVPQELQAFERHMRHLEDYVGYTGNTDRGVGIGKCIT